MGVGNAARTFDRGSAIGTHVFNSILKPAFSTFPVIPFVHAVAIDILCPLDINRRAFAVTDTARERFIIGRSEMAKAVALNCGYDEREENAEHPSVILQNEGDCRGSTVFVTL